MVGAAFAAVPLYTRFCQAHRLRRHDAARAEAAPTTVLDRDRDGPLRHQCRAGLPLDASSPSSAAQTVQIGETELAFFQVTNTVRQADHRPGRLQRRAGDRRRLFQQDSSASASPSRRSQPGAERGLAGGLLRRPGVRDGSGHQGRPGDHPVLHLLPAPAAQAGACGGSARSQTRQSATDELWRAAKRGAIASRTRTVGESATWPRRTSSTTTTWSIRARGRWSARSPPSSWPSAASSGMKGLFGLPQGATWLVLALGLRRRPLHDDRLVERRDQGGQRRATTPRSSRSACATA